MTNAFGSPRHASGRIFDLPNLDEARERDLLNRVHHSTCANDRDEALSELWMSHGKLVMAIAAKYRRSDIDHDDLINAGHLGLHAAIVRFDLNRYESRLSSYATVWIRWFILDYIRRNSGPVRLPESRAHRQLAQSGSRLLAEARAACQREGVAPTEDELHARVGARVGLAADEVARVLRLLRGGRVTLMERDEDAGDASEHLPDDTALSDDDMIQRLDYQRLRARLRHLAGEILGEREREIFLARSLTNSDRVPSLDDFAIRYGVSIARVHQIETSARRKIATALAASGYTDANGDQVVAHLSQVRARRGDGRRGTATEASAVRAIGESDEETLNLLMGAG
jgi:RNA polymerase sigma-32 factor